MRQILFQTSDRRIRKSIVALPVTRLMQVSRPAGLRGGLRCLRRGSKAARIFDLGAGTQSADFCFQQDITFPTLDKAFYCFPGLIERHRLRLAAEQLQYADTIPV